MLALLCADMLTACLAVHGNDAPDAGLERATHVPADYHLVWEDRFDAPSLDATSWNVSTEKRDGALDSADSISTGPQGLTIRTWTGNGQSHTGWLDSAGRRTFVYGYFESMIRFHGASGEHCAFWLDTPTRRDLVADYDPGQSGVEIDVVEHRRFDASGADISREIPSTVHWNGAGPKHRSVSSAEPGQHATSPDASVDGQWHTYALLWRPGSYTFYFDGLPHWSTTTAISHVPEYLMLTCEVGAAHGWAGPVPVAGYGTAQASEVGMDVRYVRVYQKR